MLHIGAVQKWQTLGFSSDEVLIIFLKKLTKFDAIYINPHNKQQVLDSIEKFTTKKIGLNPFWKSCIAEDLQFLKWVFSLYMMIYMRYSFPDFNVW